MATILFQGDSITWAGRAPELDAEMGCGYAALAAARLGRDEPGAHRFFNRGVSGNRSLDVYARIKVDILNLKPDVMSLLIGVNDVWHDLSIQNGISAGKFERVCRMLLEEILEELPQIKIMLLEPFLLRGTSTVQNYDWFRSEVEARAAVIRRLAQEYGFPFIPLQAELDHMSEAVSAAYWLRDGVHPTLFFHQHMADQWLSCYRSLHIGAS